MIDGLDVEMIEKTDPSNLNSLLQAVDLVNVSLSVDPKNITGKKKEKKLGMCILAKRQIHQIL